MQIKAREIGPGAPPFVIAEVGVNHDGSFARAAQLIECAHAAGADAVKLQYFEADRLLSRAAILAEYQVTTGGGSPLQLLRALELSENETQALLDVIHAHGMAAIVTVFSLEHVLPMLALGWDAFKTASPDIVNMPLLRALAQDGRPMIVSTGAATLEEVRAGAREISNANIDFALLQCVSAYPTPDELAELGGIVDLAMNTNVPIGYSDHTSSQLTGARAVELGACIIEKHLTYDRNARGPDHAASLNPEEMKRYIQLIRAANVLPQEERMRARTEKRVLPIEEDVRHVSRQSIVGTRDCSPGDVISQSDVTLKRPGGGLMPAMLHSVIGARVMRQIQSDMPLMAEDIHLSQTNMSACVTT
ncbi:MAG: N-acetylneuraminate synthase family protein [Phycisphaerales bacterium]